MRKEILVAFALASLILIAPITGIANENKVSSNLPEQDIDELVVQIQNVIDEVLEKYGHIPTVRGLCNVIRSVLDRDNLILYCILLLMLILPLFMIVTIIFVITQKLPTYLGGLLFVFVALYDRECSPPTSLKKLLSPFNSIYTMLETKPYPIYQLDDCPCLQEGGNI